MDCEYVFTSCEYSFQCCVACFLKQRMLLVCLNNALFFSLLTLCGHLYGRGAAVISLFCVDAERC